MCDLVSIVSQSSTSEFRQEPEIQPATDISEIQAQIIPQDDDFDIDGI
jgi:hypothetical protein